MAERRLERAQLIVGGALLGNALWEAQAPPQGSEKSEKSYSTSNSNFVLKRVRDHTWKNEISQ
jgi:hypothetical protein